MSRRRATDGFTLYVRQVHYAARPDDLRVVFERMGPVRDVYIPLDYYTHESRGFAYVKYEDARDAERAYRQLHGCAVLGRRISIEWAEGDRKTKSEMREKEERLYGRYRCESRTSRSSPRRRSRERSSSSKSSSREPSRTRSSSVRRGVKRSASRSLSPDHRKGARRSGSRSSVDSAHSNANISETTKKYLVPLSGMLSTCTKREIGKVGHSSGMKRTKEMFKQAEASTRVERDDRRKKKIDEDERLKLSENRAHLTGRISEKIENNATNRTTNSEMGRKDSLETEGGIFDELEERSEEGDSDQEEVVNGAELVESHEIKSIGEKRNTEGTHLEVEEGNVQVIIADGAKAEVPLIGDAAEKKADKALEEGTVEFEDKRVVREQREGRGSKTEGTSNKKKKVANELTSKELDEDNGMRTEGTYENTALEGGKSKDKEGSENVNECSNCNVEVGDSINKRDNTMQHENQIYGKRDRNVDDEKECNVGVVVVVKRKGEERCKEKSLDITKMSILSGDEAIMQNDEDAPEEHSQLDAEKMDELEAVEEVDFTDESKDSEEGCDSGQAEVITFGSHKEIGDSQETVEKLDECERERCSVKQSGISGSEEKIK